jgi:hypothetical protein
MPTLSGLWQDSVAIESGALKWGTGINPVHSVYGEGPPLRSSEVPTGYGPGMPHGTVPPEILDPGPDVDYNYLEEDWADPAWGYGPDTGTSDRAPLGESTEVSRSSTTPAWPPWGPVKGGMPSGSNIRARDHGGALTRLLKLGYKSETVNDGWENKDVSGVDNARVSDPSQYEMQTSMTQRDKVREGSQAQPGRASEYTAPIGSSRPTWGQRMKLWSGTPNGRHYDMFPYQADEIIRPWRVRSAAAGPVGWLAANEAYNYQLDALERQPVPDPYSGNPVPAPGNVYQEEESDVSTWVNAWY